MKKDFSQYYTLDNFINYCKNTNALMISTDEEEKDKLRKEIQTSLGQSIANFLQDMAKDNLLSPIRFSEGHPTTVSELWNKIIKQEKLTSYDINQVELIFYKVLTIASMNFKKEPEDDEFYKKRYSDLIEKFNSGTFSFHELENDSSKCPDCGQRLKLMLKDWEGAYGVYGKKEDGSIDHRKLVLPESCLVEQNIKLNVNFPSGELIITDWVRVDGFTETVMYNGKDKYDDDKSLNTKIGRIFNTQHYAQEHNFINVSIGNTSPKVFQDMDTLVIGYVDENKDKSHASSHFKRVGDICTDLWAATIIDKETLIEILTKHHKNRETAQEVLNQYLQTDTNHQLLYINPGQYTLEFNPDHRNFNQHSEIEPNNDIQKYLAIYRNSPKPKLKRI